MAARVRPITSRLIGCGGLLLLTSCYAPRSFVRGISSDVGYCAPPVPYRQDSTYRTLATYNPLTDSTLGRRYSAHSLLVANAVGVLPQLRQLTRLRTSAENTPATNRQMLALREQIDDRLALVITEIASTAAELDCEGERANQAATYELNQDNRHIRLMTMLSITVGAVTTIVTTLMQQGSFSSTPEAVVAIGGGTLSAGLGASTLFTSGRIRFRHTRNLLSDVWYERSTSTVYPPTIWSILTNRAFSNSKQFSVAHNIRDRWRHFDGLSRDDTRESRRTQALFFGTGGDYTASELQVRAAMLNQVQSSVRLINQDVQVLMSELSR